MCHGHSCSVAGTSIHRGWAAATAATKAMSPKRSSSSKVIRHTPFELHKRRLQKSSNNNEALNTVIPAAINNFHSLQYFYSAWKIFIKNYNHLISANNTKNKESAKIVTQKFHILPTPPAANAINTYPLP